MNKLLKNKTRINNFLYGFAHCKDNFKYWLLLITKSKSEYSIKTLMFWFSLNLQPYFTEGNNETKNSNKKRKYC